MGIFFFSSVSVVSKIRLAGQCNELAIGNINDSEFVVSYANKTDASLAVIGPETPLAKGVADALWDAGVKVVGPKKDLAQMETSKGVTRDLLKTYNIPGGPKYQTFNSIDGVVKFLT